MNVKLREFLDGKKFDSKETFRTFQYTLQNFQKVTEEGGGDLNHLTEFDIKYYFQKREDKKISTKQKEYSIILSFLKYHSWQDRMNVIEYPEEKVVSLERKSIDNIDIAKIKREIEKMNRKLNGDWKKGGKMRVALIYTLIYTGLRVTELVNLNKDDLDIRERTGTIQVIGKGNKSRTVPAPKELRRKLTEYLSEREDNSPVLFISNREQRISVRNVQDILARLNDHCGFKKGTIHPHVFRHTFLYQTAKQVPLTTLTQLAGHDDPKTTMIYTTPNLQEVGEKLDNLYEE
ncbi:tyrosine-type recombinase/integrase [Cytobacillus horneckiae]|uniref:tyrosine-type recombinase/integrase n=1 Tax=Cytobacillus horneckiae TaxID=549687 RepID=UPI0039A24CD7